MEGGTQLLRHGVQMTHKYRVVSCNTSHGNNPFVAVRVNDQLVITHITVNKSNSTPTCSLTCFQNLS